MVAGACASRSILRLTIIQPSTSATHCSERGLEAYNALFNVLEASTSLGKEGLSNKPLQQCGSTAIAVLCMRKEEKTTFLHGI
jgi:hypothetical protein